MCLRLGPSYQIMLRWNKVFKTLKTETTALFEQLVFEFLADYPVFAPIRGGKHGFISHQNS